MALTRKPDQESADRTGQAYLAQQPRSEPVGRLWLVRAEREGQDEAFNFREGVTSIHWNESPDPRTLSRRELEAYFAAHPEHGGANAAEQEYRFCHELRIGDFVVTMLWNHGHRYQKLAVGVVTGEYEYLDHDPEPAPRQMRRVYWLRTDLDRESLREETQDRLQYRYTFRRIHDADILHDLLIQVGSNPAQEGRAGRS